MAVESALGKKLRQLRESRGLSFYRLEKLIGISQGYLKTLEQGGVLHPRIDTLQRLASVYDTSIEELMSDSALEIKPGLPTDALLEFRKSIDSIVYREFSWLGEVVKVSIKGHIPAGYPCIREEETGEFVFIPKSYLTKITAPDKLFALIVDGESLAGDGIHSGDSVLVQPVTNCDIHDKIYVCKIDNECTLKHVRCLQDGRFQLRSSNSHYEDITPDQLEIIGLVVYHQPKGRELA